MEYRGASLNQSGVHVPCHVLRHGAGLGSSSSPPTLPVQQLVQEVRKRGGGEGTTWLLGEVGGVEQSGSWGGLNPLGVHVPCDEAWGLVSWPCPCNEEEMGLASASIQRPRMQLCKPPITARSEALPDMNLLHT